MAGPLDGVRILDLSRLLPGPACTWYLQGLGASVDRVEAPGAGDFTRHVPPFADGVGAIFAALSRGKRSLALDLRKPAAIDAIRRMLPRYDVVVEGFKPGVMEAMGLDPVGMVSDRPGLVVARISGYGQTGPWRDRPGHDVNYMGVTGSLAMSALTHGAPGLLPVQVADLSGALVAAMGIAAALYDVTKGGPGRVLDVSLTEAALSFVAPYAVGFTTEGREPAPGAEVLSGGLPVYGTYRCADGRYLTIGALEPKFQMALAAETGATGREDLARVFATRPRDEWVDALAEACVGPALGFSEIADHPQLKDRGAVLRIGRTTWIRPPLAESLLDGPVPTVGQHTDAILAEAGLSPAERAAVTGTAARA